MKIDVENNLKNWDLFKSYGQFNLSFESVVARFRELLIKLVRRNYGFNVDWEDPNTEDVIDNYLQDRLMKIILSDNGAYAIIDKCRACFLDILEPDLTKILIENEIEPINLSKFDREFAAALFKKALEMIVLRNTLIHSHFEGVLFNLRPMTLLEGKKDIKTATGYEERQYHYTIEFLDRVNEHLFHLDYFTKSLSIQTTLSEGKDHFKQEDLIELNKMDFKPPILGK